MTTRQQKRARSRAPVKPSRGRSGLIFSVVMLALLAAGGVLVLLARDNPPERTRGAIIGEHWHADYRVEICGRLLAPFPFVEGDVHSHHDAQIHVHPTSQATSGPNANLGAFFRTYEMHIGQLEDGRRGIIMPDGTRFLDGEDACPDGRTYELEVFVDGEALTGDPAAHIVHDGQDVLVRYGPEADLEAPPLFPPGLPGIDGLMPEREAEAEDDEPGAEGAEPGDEGAEPDDEGAEPGAEPAEDDG